MSTIRNTTIFLLAEWTKMVPVGLGFRLAEFVESALDSSSGRIS
jgi:hypothetical protein